VIVASFGADFVDVDTNTGTSSFYSHPVDLLTANAPPGSTAKLIASIPVPDDFTLARGASKAFVGAQGLGNVVYVDIASGGVEEILTDLTFAPTSVAVSGDGKSVYVTSSGALNGGVQGVAKINVSAL
jgi:DNA-binding beta-propeller fold protein YncE